MDRSCYYLNEGVYSIKGHKLCLLTRVSNVSFCLGVMVFREAAQLVSSNMGHLCSFLFALLGVLSFLMPPFLNTTVFYFKFQPRPIKSSTKSQIDQGDINTNIKLNKIKKKQKLKIKREIAWLPLKKHLFYVVILTDARYHAVNIGGVERAIAIPLSIDSSTS